MTPEKEAELAALWPRRSTKPQTGREIWEARRDREADKVARERADKAASWSASRLRPATAIAGHVELISAHMRALTAADEEMARFLAEAWAERFGL